MYKKFISAITWNSINVVTYKTILLLHQIILFYFIPHELYGISGTLFAALYLLISCTNFGFEYSLFTFFAHYTKNKQNFMQLIYQSGLKLACTLAAAGTAYFFASFFFCKVPAQIIPYLLAIFIAESIRKYLETIAQLAFLNKQIMIIQTSMISCYVAMIWISYFFVGSISLHTIFAPMVITSCMEALLVLASLYKWHKKIPSATASDSYEPIKISFMAREQLYSYINQLSKSLFSPNFLIVLIAYYIGMQQTATIRFFTNTITLLYMLLSRSVAIPSGALFSSVTQESFQTTKQLFLSITNAYIQLLYALAIIIATTIAPHLFMHQPESQTTILILLFFLAGFIEYVTLTYEKLYIVQHKAHQLALINGCCALLFIGVMCAAPLLAAPITSSLFLLPMCLIRIVTAYIIGLYAYKKWAIRPNLMISCKSLSIGLLLSAGLNIIVRLCNY